MPTARLTIRALLTEQCNLACVFCHNEGQPSTVAQMSLPPETLLHTVRAAATIATQVTVKLSGGEPTLHPRFAEYLSAAVTAGADDVVVITNAHRLPPLLDGLRRCPRLRFSVNVPSCNGAVYHRMTGAMLDMVIHNVRALVSAGGSVSLNSYWPGNRTRQELAAMVDFARQLKTTLKLLAPCQIAGTAAEHHSSRRACRTRRGHRRPARPARRGRSRCLRRPVDRATEVEPSGPPRAPHRTGPADRGRSTVTRRGWLRTACPRSSDSACGGCSS
jgi:molybdenum cofactor biosynthesis enzyme MoaA